MGLYTVEAVVVRVRDLGESDRLVTLFSREKGKFAVSARGSRRMKSSLAGGIHPFSRSRFSIFETKGLHSLRQVEVLDYYRPVREDIARMAAASYLMEVLDRVLEEGAPQVRIYNLVTACLGLLAGTGDVELVARYFEVQFLNLTGYRPQLGACVRCGRKVTTKGRFSVADGGIVCSACAIEPLPPISPESRNLLNRLLFTPPERLGTVEMDRSRREEIRRLLRSYIEYNLESRIKSATFLDMIISEGAKSF